MSLATGFTSRSPVQQDPVQTDLDKSPKSLSIERCISTKLLEENKLNTDVGYIVVDREL